MGMVSTMNAVANTESGSTSDNTPESVGSESDPELPKDELFHLLQNQRRRRVMLFLQDADSEETMRDVAEQVAAWENDTTVEALSSNERQRVYIALYQSHLPKLDDAGVLDYNQQRGIVSRTPLADQLDTHLNVDTEDEKSTDKESTGDESESADVMGVSALPSSAIVRYYGAATLASVLVTAVTWTGLVAMNGLALATFITGLFVAVTLGVAAKNQFDTR
jgi:hypothetical protein